MLKPNVCALQNVCHVQGNWQLISHAIEAALESVSLEALAKPTLQQKQLLEIQHIATGVHGG